MVDLDDWIAEGVRLFGHDRMLWEFICPDCGRVQKPQDFLDLGMHQHQADTIASYSCIRRWTDQGCMSTGKGPVLLKITPAEPIRPTFDWNR